MHLNFALKLRDSFIYDCICQKNMIKKLARDHVFKFKTLSFYRTFVRKFWACTNFAFYQLRLHHRAFFLPFMLTLFLPFCRFANFAFLALHYHTWLCTTQAFALPWRTNLNMLTCNEAHLQNFEDFFPFKIGFFTSAWMKIYCYWTSFCISLIWFPVFKNF